MSADHRSCSNGASRRHLGFGEPEARPLGVEQGGGDHDAAQGPQFGGNAVGPETVGLAQAAGKLLPGHQRGVVPLGEAELVLVLAVQQMAEAGYGLGGRALQEGRREQGAAEPSEGVYALHGLAASLDGVGHAGLVVLDDDHDGRLVPVPHLVAEGERRREGGGFTGQSDVNGAGIGRCPREGLGARRGAHIGTATVAPGAAPAPQLEPAGSDVAQLGVPCGQVVEHLGGCPDEA